MHREVSEIWADVDADDSVNAVIVTGDGKTFSAGGDLNHERKVCEDYALRMQAMTESRNLVYGMLNCRKPIVGAARGWAVGAGLALLILADVSIASKTAMFSDGHLKIGVAAGRPRGHRLAAAVRHGQGQVLPDDRRELQRRGGRAHEPDLDGARTTTRSRARRSRWRRGWPRARRPACAGPSRRSTTGSARRRRSSMHRWRWSSSASRGPRARRASMPSCRSARPSFDPDTPV